MSDSAKKYPEILADLRDQTSREAEAMGMESDAAAILGMRIAEAMRKMWGGGYVYIPKGKFIEQERRDTEIWERFNGRNHRELCKIYDISLQHLYRIIKTRRRVEVARRQADLPLG